MLRPAIILGWICLVFMVLNAYRSFRFYQKGSVTRAHLVNHAYSVVVLLMILIGLHLTGTFMKIF
ncbi:MAG TPA: hypothetical protein V6C82_06350 [Chroococcales cyanobacterium]